jgi:protein SFI1
LDPGHENALFRWICSVGDSTRQQHASGQKVDLVYGLRTVLAAQGIETILDDEDLDDETRSLRVSNTPPKPTRAAKPGRRVSFGDAHVEETWLSERSASTRPLPDLAQEALGSAPRRGSDVAASQRPRYVSGPVPPAAEPPARHAKQSLRPEHRSGNDEQKNATLVLEVSWTQLEQNAEAFFGTTEMRSARRLLHVWHDQALALRSARAQAWSFASNHDRRKLLKESLETLVGAHERRRLERKRILEAERLERMEQAREAQRMQKLDTLLVQFQNERRQDILWTALAHLREEIRYQRKASAFAQAKVLKVRYFRRWRRITLENATKARSILTRKFIRRWRDKVARELTVHEQARAHYEESLAKRCFKHWFWQFCSNRVENWREQRLEHKMFTSWVGKLQNHYAQEDQAADFRNRRMLLQGAFQTLLRRKDELQLASQTALSLYNRKLSMRCLHFIQLRAKLTPREKTLTVKVGLDLKRKAFTVWRLRLTLTFQAAEVNRKRILQSTWTNWNDALRCRALAQRIDERVLIENLYKWVLQERLQAFRRSQNGHLLRRILTGWSRNVREETTALEQASINFVASQRTRMLRSGLVRLNIALRAREDAQRAAIEFANSRALPGVLRAWKTTTEHSRMLAKWAADARFYALATRTLKLWRERTEQTRHRRRRDAYARIRARVKLRIVGTCFVRWRAQNAAVQSLQRDASTRAQARLFQVGTDAFDLLRGKAMHYATLELEATAMDHQKLLGSALAALMSGHAHRTALDQRARDFRQDTLDLAARALKRIQRATFTAARHAEVADALRAWHRDRHIKQMLRHWASQAHARRAARTEQEDPRRRDPDSLGGDSPSLRPASRVAARSVDRRPATAIATATDPAGSPAPRDRDDAATPAYLRTPSRSRKAARFRPVLPTPAAVTPFAFAPGYFVTTPAPLVRAGEDGGEVGGARAALAGLTPQITPFARKLRDGGVTPAGVPPSALRGSVFGRSMGGGGTGKSVRFARGRFGLGDVGLSPAEESG